MQRLLILLTLLSSCVYGQWITGYYQANNGTEPVGSIPWTKYTHVIHSSAVPGPNGTVVDGSLVPSENSQFTAAAHAAGVKAIVSLTGGNDDDTSFLFNANTQPGLIDTFVKQIVQYLNTYGYDGVDLDWEDSINVAQYADLITRLRAALGSSKLLTIAAYGGSNSPLQAIVQAGPGLLDQVNLMCYDEDVWTGYTWFVTSLSAGPDNQVSIESAVREFTGQGVPASKLGLGLALYGRHYTGASAPYQVGATRVGAWTNYSTLVTQGLLTEANQQYDATHGGAYLSLPASNEFYPYTSPRLLQEVAAWGKAQGVGGYMTFLLDYEYLPSQTGEARYPLSSTLFAAVFNQ